MLTETDSTATLDARSVARGTQSMPPLPPALNDVALVGAATCAATGEMSVSWWLEEVRAGRAPKPVIQQARCTRWRLADVVRFWAERASMANEDAAQRMHARAKNASNAAQAKRSARPTVAPAA